MSDLDTTQRRSFTSLTYAQYVFRFGMLVWGVTTGVLFALLQSYLQGGSFLYHLVPALVLFPLGGIFWGHCMYKFNERVYGKASEGAKE